MFIAIELSNIKETIFFDNPDSWLNAGQFCCMSSLVGLAGYTAGTDTSQGHPKHTVSGFNRRTKLVKKCNKNYQKM